MNDEPQAGTHHNVYQLPSPVTPLSAGAQEVHQVSPIARVRRVTYLFMLLLIVAPWWVGCYEITRWLV